MFYHKTDGNDCMYFAYESLRDQAMLPEDCVMCIGESKNKVFDKQTYADGYVTWRKKKGKTKIPGKPRGGTPLTNFDQIEGWLFNCDVPICGPCHGCRQRYVYSIRASGLFDRLYYILKPLDQPIISFLRRYRATVDPTEKNIRDTKKKGPVFTSSPKTLDRYVQVDADTSSVSPINDVIIKREQAPRDARPPPGSMVDKTSIDLSDDDLSSSSSSNEEDEEDETYKDESGFVTGSSEEEDREYQPECDDEGNRIHYPHYNRKSIKYPSDDEEQDMNMNEPEDSTTLVKHLNKKRSKEEVSSEQGSKKKPKIGGDDSANEASEGEKEEILDDSASTPDSQVPKDPPTMEIPPTEAQNNLVHDTKFQGTSSVDQLCSIAQDVHTHIVQLSAAVISKDKKISELEEQIKSLLQEKEETCKGMKSLREQVKTVLEETDKEKKRLEEKNNEVNRELTANRLRMKSLTTEKDDILQQSVEFKNSLTCYEKKVQILNGKMAEHDTQTQKTTETTEKLQAKLDRTETDLKAMKAAFATEVKRHKGMGVELEAAKREMDGLRKALDDEYKKQVAELKSKRQSLHKIDDPPIKDGKKEDDNCDGIVDLT